MTRIATVSYLNAQPLIDGIENEQGIALSRRVPSDLLATIESGEADIALCPVIDFQTSAVDLEIVASGAIGCRGPALTVKLFSSRPFAELESIVVDGESHTSVALLRIVLHEIHRCRPELVSSSDPSAADGAQALLLIGDKVIHSSPDADRYHHRLDLGAAWKEISGSPFVFATWMTRRGTDLGDVPHRLDRIRRTNRKRLAEIAVRHAATSGWPDELAIRYLSSNLRYELGPEELAGIEEFWERCRDLGIIDELRAMRLYGGDG